MIAPILASGAHEVLTREWQDAGTILWQIAAVLFLVLLNGFFVASEFAIVKVRGSQLEALEADPAHCRGFVRGWLTGCNLAPAEQDRVVLWPQEWGVRVASFLDGVVEAIEGEGLTDLTRGEASAVLKRAHVSAEDVRGVALGFPPARGATG